MMFKISNRIPNDGAPSFINEVCFKPDGTMFGATFEHNNEIRLYNAQTLSVVKVLRNPGAMLDRPHGIWLTARHVIVTNKGTYPSQFRVFRLDEDSCLPVHAYSTPYGHLAAGHSLALSGRRLVVTYCNGRTQKGALVSYDYDDKSGKITGPLDIQERWFRRYGDGKGICFDEKGEKVYVTFNSRNWDMSWPRKTVTHYVKNTISFGHFGATWRNGIAAFGIDSQGRFTRRPLWKKIFGEFCRLENVHVCGDRAVITDPISGRIYLYDLRNEDAFEAPSHVLAEDLVFPHGAKISPDGKRLVVTDDGIEVVNRVIHWDSFVSPRKDRLVVFDLQAA